MKLNIFELSEIISLPIVAKFDLFEFDIIFLNRDEISIMTRRRSSGFQTIIVTEFESHTENLVANFFIENLLNGQM